MTAHDPDWTPEAAYDILRDALATFMAGDASATGLYDWLTGTFATPPDTPSTHPAQSLYKMAVADVSVFLQCDFERSDLVESLQQAIRIVESGHGGGLTKITRSPCFFELLRNEQIPAPLINLTAQNKRAEWEREGFRKV